MGWRLTTCAHTQPEDATDQAPRAAKKRPCAHGTSVFSGVEVAIKPTRCNLHFPYTQALAVSKYETIANALRFPLGHGYRYGWTKQSDGEI